MNGRVLAVHTLGSAEEENAMTLIVSDIRIVPERILFQKSALFPNTDY
jgi:hypothetical protein